MSELQDTCWNKEVTPPLAGTVLARPDRRSVPTPDMWVVHTRLVVAQGDEGSVGRPPVDQVKQNLLVVDSQVVHVLWGGGGGREGRKNSSPTP